jgi:multidrug efflux system outer membrane protein
VKKLLILLALCSCSVKPDYCRPVIDSMPEAWRFPIENATEYANIDWWKQLDDPVLDDLIQTALANNQNLQVATARVLEFFARYRVAASELFPQIYLDTGAERQKTVKPPSLSGTVPTSIAGIPIPSAITAPIQSAVNSLTSALVPPRINNIYHLFVNLLSYEVDFWGRIRSSIESAKYQYLAEMNARKNIIVTLVASLAQSYIQLKQYDAQLRISKKTYESRLISWDIARKRFDVGLISNMEVKQAESQAQDAEIQIKNFELFVATTEDLISVLIGAPPQAINRGVLLTQLKKPKAIPSGLPSDLISNRPDVIQAEDQLIAANAQIGVARAAFLPTFDLTGTIGQRSNDLHNLLNNPASLFDGAVDVLQPLYTGGRLDNQLLQAEALYKEALHTYKQTILTALQEVNDALISHEKAKEKAAIHAKEVLALEEYLRLSQLRYENGQNDYLTVVNSETSLFQVQLAEVINQAGVFLSLVDLYKALGQGWGAATDYTGYTQGGADTSFDNDT